MTFIELTVVIMVMISFISLIFLGARAWKAGSDRASCIMNINNMQKGIRGYSNIYGYSPGSTVPDLLTQIIGFGRFVESTPSCPRQGEYAYGAEFGQDTIPPIGALYLTCSLAVSHEHEPEDYGDW